MYSHPNLHKPREYKMPMLVKRIKRLTSLLAYKIRHPSCTFDILGTSNCVHIHKEATLKNVRIVIRGSRCNIRIDKAAALKNCLVYIRGNQCNVTIAEKCRLGEKVDIICEDHFSSVNIGASSEFFGPISIAATEGTAIYIDNNCMIAPGCSIRSGDSHSIFKNNARINPAKDIQIESRCWLGERVLVLKGAFVPEGCVVGAASVIIKAFQEKNCILAGVPARVVNKGITWGKER
jgi:acetyltransferase-like isoleucine patch superfamily enzyme